MLSSRTASRCSVRTASLDKGISKVILASARLI